MSMITEFIDSWGLFGMAYLAAISGALLLSLVGVMVVARDQVFLAAAVSQTSMLGVAAGLLFGVGNPALLAIAFSIGAAVFINHRTGRGGVTHQETTGLVFLLASALSIVLLAKQPFGLKEVQALAASTMIGATGFDVAVFSSLLALVVAFVIARRRPLVLWLSDPVMAAAVGLRIGAWSLAASVALGLGAGLMLRSTGLLFTFGCLVLPAMAAKNLSRTVAGLFWIAPIVALLGVMAGLLAAHTLDLPPGQVVVAVLGALCVASAAVGRLGKPLG